MKRTAFAPAGLAIALSILSAGLRTESDSQEPTSSRTRRQRRSSMNRTATW